MPARLGPDLDSEGGLAALFAAVADAPAIGLAVSGGADSLALLVLAQRWATSLAKPPRLHVYSVDHGLRPEAEAEVAMVLAACQSLGVAGTALRWDGDKPQSGLQEAARLARYRLIGAAMKSDGVAVLLTAHHRNDQAETVLMRLAHGSGIEGLKGMAPMAQVEGVRLHRPLLDVPPDALLSVVEAAGLEPAADPSNVDPHYERVRWRQAMPGLSKLGLDAATLALFAARMSEADAAIAQMAEACFSEIVRLDGFGSARIELLPFMGLSAAIATRVLSRVLNIVGGRQKPRALGQVERLRESIANDDLPRSTTVLGCVVRIKGDAIAVAREPGRSLPPDALLHPRGELVWDERFRIINGSDDKTLTASVADYLPRHRLEDFLGFKVTAPAEAIRTAPIVRDAEGGVLSLGGWSFDERITVQLLID
ncbi:tRNA lysidine(34) synthetase TilS [Devosia sp. BSSL-BM10]|uniref:tRNA(Ile)-lysidine synthase n=1 Tax=Devosia litorisediminis TaxID=2829817 RepID=A0A942I4F9_9HYPH|nr:tRNA lysidine(34) synthetase TilS [Devosia litorisediminis]MBS3847251.1 tRNA lysidine(34) synthetase TilS [Devosia litorisediminis]